MIRLVFVLCCVLTLSVVVMADANAQVGACPSGGGCSREQAYSACMEASPTYIVTPDYNVRCRANQGAAPTATSGQYVVDRRFKQGSYSQMPGAYYWTGSCPAGTQWNEFTKKCDGPCNTKPPMTNVRFQVTGGIAGSACSGGCEYIVDLQSGSGPAGLTTIGDMQFYRAPSMVPSGEYCTVGNEPITNDDQACATQGNLTQCIKPDGQHCATASSGKQFCWQPGENGIKASGNDAATKSPDGTTPKPPPLPPNNGGEWTQTGQSTVTTTINDTTQTSNVTGWQSSYGSQGQGAHGNGASGEGNSGSGSGSGLGNGNGHGDDEEDDDGPGGPGAGVDDLYTPTDKTIASVFAAFKARVGESPLVDAIDGFFTVNASGGCPTWTVPASEYWDSMTWDKHCSGDMLNSLQAIGFVLMAIAAFLAAIWALS